MLVPKFLGVINHDLLYYRDWDYSLSSDLMTWPSCKVLMVIQKGSYKTAKVCSSLINAVLPDSFMIGILCQHVLWCWKVLDELICTGLGILAGTWIKSLLSPCLHVYVYLGNMKEIGIKVIRQWWTIFARVGDLLPHFLKLKFQMFYLLLFLFSFRNKRDWLSM